MVPALTITRTVDDLEDPRRTDDIKIIDEQNLVIDCFERCRLIEETLGQRSR